MKEIITRNTGVSVAVLICMITASAWAVMQIYEIKLFMKDGFGEVGKEMIEYHIRLNNIENKIDYYSVNLSDHLKAGGHQKMEARMDNVEKRIDGGY